MKFRRRLTPNATVDLVPMIDVVFQLVVFFMVSSTFVMTPAISLTLPESTTAESIEVTQIAVSVISDSEIYLNDTRHDLVGLKDALMHISLAEREKTKTVVIEGDEGVSYRLMIDVMDALRESGFKGISLKTRVPIPGT